ncbi:monovalent cation/H(+) antiporter subunit G [Orenia marismortui]|uniref:Multisubunit sodium/proton antiporter MrpG subunit n=1 Tax=Orenia marismortui TaxID=46469 RepID=A0A4R8GQF1_9FIRM|nr:monovalent cation/H(+) antiporter subunit G [Orenia marismortui]TDX48025.1 multisubunit sodium/proton antiporter MrpG subunit [Orenia marismortui]
MVNGTFFFLITAIGMIRFEDFYTKLHIGSKCLTGGGISILLGIIFLKGFSLYSLKLGLIIVFLIITNPITTHAIARAAYYSDNENKHKIYLVRDDLKEKSIGELQ